MRQMVCVMVAVAANVAMLSGVWADEEKIPLDKLPKAVVEAVKKRFPKAEMKEASKEIEDGKTQQRQWLYLGYYILNCGSMNYKNRFRPHQILQSYVADTETPEWVAQSVK